MQSRWTELIRGVLAGNIFDWGAKAVADMLETGAIDFDVALSKLQGKFYHLYFFYCMNIFLAKKIYRIFSYGSKCFGQP